MQRHWLLRKLVNHTNPPSLRQFPEPTAQDKKPVKSIRSPKDSVK
jgi:hypothetical protein